MTITTDQFDEIQKVMRAYVYRHQPDDRGPGCRACARVAHYHSANAQPVCETVSDLLYDLEKLLEKPEEKP